MNRIGCSHLLDRKANGAQRRRGFQPGCEFLEMRCVMSGFRAITGFDNNLAHPTWGQAGIDLRASPAKYADGLSAPSLPQAPSARVLSNVLNDQTDPNNPSQDISTVDRNSLSAFGYVWGQFVDHDLDLTLDNSKARVREFGQETPAP
jgi:hypothetical protein